MHSGPKQRWCFTTRDLNTCRACHASSAPRSPYCQEVYTVTSMYMFCCKQKKRGIRRLHIFCTAYVCFTAYIYMAVIVPPSEGIDQVLLLHVYFSAYYYYTFRLVFASAVPAHGYGECTPTVCCVASMSLHVQYIDQCTLEKLRKGGATDDNASGQLDANTAHRSIDKTSCALGAAQNHCCARILYGALWQKRMPQILLFALSTCARRVYMLFDLHRQLRCCYIGP
jgi:hypothetical protein